ncbi:MAG: amidohydrolase family protein [Nitrospinota bacterium]|nr:amidohydrolase family protein [Nitrospinota bacterium]
MDRPVTGATLKVTAQVIIIDSSTVLRDGAIIVHEGKVAEIGPSESLKGVKADRSIRLPGHILHPGLVNAHCHLELSYMKGKLAPGAPFTDWIRELMALRIKTKNSTIRGAIANGVRRLMATGTTCVGDVTQTGLTAAALARQGIRGVVFHEVLGLDPSLAEERFGGLLLRVREGRGSDGMLRQGVAPHAVYSTSGVLMREVARFATKGRLPLCIHLAETLEEQEFSRHGKGPFRDLLRSMGQYKKEWAPGKRPSEVVRDAEALEGALAVHFNHPSRGDIAALKKAGAKVAYCPNSNRWFGRKAPHPLPELLRQGVTVGLGTDSLASNSDLDIRAEMRRVMKTFPDMGAGEVFRMATDGGARALGYTGAAPGTLAPSAPFDAAAIKLKIGPRRDPLRSVIESRNDYSRLWVEGRPLRIPKGFEWRK